MMSHNLKTCKFAHLKNFDWTTVYASIERNPVHFRGILIIKNFSYLFFEQIILLFDELSPVVQIQPYVKENIINCQWIENFM